ncbi:DNA polymerase III subunit epsilon [Acinetobacter silvestris]|uniref:Ribonuclease H n=1 Tax=Acinetobacter silvestris TaxID=1977882 RepID=A0A1Y3CHQ4_9GAMM|nr:DNA polymerase III subunit epsilon [Acinetobacter silvestris]OTG66655.1 DNA polymerase III subunit epsilon [Acinetobacter silvestris]
MSQTITLYVDGACKGNPGLGGWGAYIIMGNNDEHKICGGEAETTNNRMELTAAIEGIAFCPVEAKLIIWTDSIYVKRGITEWIEGWKKKNWKDVKNPDLWKKLDSVCKNRDIEWNWIKGHSGHAGNEMADQLANLGVEQTLSKIKNGTLVTTTNNAEPDDIVDKKKDEKDWLLDDPFGFDLAESDLEDEMLIDEEIIVTQTFEQDVEVSNSEQNLISFAQNMHPQIVITPATLDLQGPRQLILDTETTGFYYQDGDRIIEVGALEMINRKLTGSSIHIYINPEKPVGDSENVHGISDDFLKDKPKYNEIADVLFDYLKGAEIIAHNATFDMNFLNMEFKRSGLQTLSEVCEVTDTLALAKRKHPGQKNSLDALVRRYEVPQRDRTFHGALLDAEILSDVYLAMTGGQVLLDIDASTVTQDQFNEQKYRQPINLELPVIMPSSDELSAHENWVKQFQEKHSETCLFAK